MKGGEEGERDKGGRMKGGGRVRGGRGGRMKGEGLREKGGERWKDERGRSEGRGGG